MHNVLRLLNTNNETILIKGKLVESMKTSKPFSVISYNSLTFFKDRLNQLYNDGKIYNAIWILHKADMDSKKDHIHATLYPTSPIETNTLLAYFKEIDKDNPTMPLTISPKIVKCLSEDDMVLYYIHDSKYLEFKGEKRNILDYKITELQALDSDYLRCAIDSAFSYRDNKLSKRLSTVEIITLAESGMSLKDIYKTYNPPYYQINAIETVFHKVLAEKENIARAYDDGYNKALDDLARSVFDSDQLARAN